MECAALVIATSPISTNCRFAKKESEISMTASDEIKSKKNSENESITKLPESSRRVWLYLETFDPIIGRCSSVEICFILRICLTAKHRQSVHRLQKIVELVQK